MNDRIEKRKNWTNSKGLFEKLQSIPSRSRRQINILESAPIKSDDFKSINIFDLFIRPFGSNYMP